jgi:hypothetical protein
LALRPSDLGGSQAKFVLRTIQTKGLPDGSNAEMLYTFNLSDPRPQVVLEITGTWAGPDNCYVKYPEQEQWLNSLSLRMRQSWDCQWTFEDEEAVEQFVALLSPFMVEP